MKVAAILPQSRNLRARLPRRQPVTTAMASVAQRSISTKVTRRLRSGSASHRGESGFGVCNAEALEAEDGHADAEDLSGAEVAVGDLGFVEEGFEVEGCGGHGLMIRLEGGFVARRWRVEELQGIEWDRR